jgi:hypothetical protein
MSKKIDVVVFEKKGKFRRVLKDTYHIPVLKGSKKGYCIGKDNLGLLEDSKKGVGVDTIQHHSSNKLSTPILDKEPLTKRESFIVSIYDGSSLEDVMMNFQDM